ncbi:MAG: DUF3820 family protein [Candidatus Algichlamydia australiensis]|nr:DUF3820 family protein [Chlamydiales bacterium]
MSLLTKQPFICFDIESTGLDTKKDQIIEIAIVKFTFDEILETYETLIDPGCPIPEESTQIHHITNEMVQGKPMIGSVLKEIVKLIGNHILVGHGIGFDIDILQNAAKRHTVPCEIENNKRIDTLRLARLYGESPTNSLQALRQHFNIPEEGAHRAMSDVVVNIEVFKFLSQNFRTAKELLERLKKPILMRQMPLGKHKARPFSEIPLDYLRWAVHQDFDMDLLFSIKSELSKRKRKNFAQAATPFSDL